MEDDNPRRWRQVERATTSFHGRAQMAGSIRGMGVVDFDDYRPTDEEAPAEQGQGSPPLRDPSRV